MKLCGIITRVISSMTATNLYACIYPYLSLDKGQLIQFYQGIKKDYIGDVCAHIDI